MTVSTFDLNFCYMFAGWKGSVHDGSVLKDSFQKGSVIPSAKYYLCDAM